MIGIHRNSVGHFIFAALIFVIAGVFTNTSRAESAGESSLSDTAILPDTVDLGSVTVISRRLPYTTLNIPIPTQLSSITRLDVDRTVTMNQYVDGLTGFRAYPVGNVWGERNVDVRGFYGGGQSQYVLAMFNGMPLNNSASGLINWDLIDPGAVSLMQSGLGPISSQYGDFGFGGILALTPRIGTVPQARISLIRGSDNASAARASGNFALGKQQLNITSSLRRNDGWRQHSQLESENLTATVSAYSSDQTTVSASFALSHRNEELPGAITEEQLLADRSSAAVDFYGETQQDSVARWDVLTGINLTHRLTPRANIHTVAHVRRISSYDLITVTAPLDHDQDILEAGVDASLSSRSANMPLEYAVGLALDYSHLSSLYMTRISPDSRLTVSAGDGRRVVTAGYLQGGVYPTSKLHLSGGIRLDYLSTKYDHDEAMVNFAASTEENTETAFSANLAASYCVFEGATIFASMARSFKAPTLIHLYDSPPIYYATPEFQGFFGISNRDLGAMTGLDFEAGIRIVRDSTAGVSVNGYLYSIRDEIDFNLATAKYENIGKSKHTGLEVRAHHAWPDLFQVKISFEYSESTFQNGEYNGNRINGVPEFSYRGELKYVQPDWIDLTLIGRGIGPQYLDQANTREIGAHTLFDGAIAFVLDRVDVTLSVHNIFDREHNTSGYIGLLGETRFYPGPGRTAHASVSINF